MEIDASLMEIFTTEAHSYLSVLQDPQADIEAKGDAAHGMKGVCAMLQFHELSEEAAVLEKQLRSGDASELEQRTATLLTKLEQIKAAAQATPRDEPQAESQKKPPAESQKEVPTQPAFSEASPKAAPPPEKKNTAEGMNPAAEKSTAAEKSSTPPAATKGASDTQAEKEKDKDENGDEWDAETTAMLRSIFREEAQEHLQTMESCLERLQKDLTDRYAVNKLFRAAHTLKGASATVGLTDISESAHSLENRFEQVRVGTRQLTPADLDVCFEATTILYNMADASSEETTIKKLGARLQKLLAGKTPPPKKKVAAKESAADPSSAADTPSALSFGSGVLDTTAPAAADRPKKREKTGPIGVIGGPTSRAETIVRTAQKEPRGYRLSSAQHPSLESAASALATEKAQQPTARDEPQAYTPEPERRDRDRRLGERRDEDRRIIRVPVDRVDTLLNSVGELVFARTRIHRRTEEMSGLLKDLAQSHRALRSALMGVGITDADRTILQRLSEIEVEFADETANFERAISGLQEEAEWLRRVTTTLQEGLIRLRMMSVRFLMARLRRTVREIARQQEKEIEVVLEGQDTELDKSVAERLVEPMVHLIRNAVAHGIETPAARKKAGKPKTGTLRISAHQEGEDVLLEVTDDGCGIDAQVVGQTAQRLNLVDEQTLLRMSEDQIRQLIFQPGFTTRAIADQVSGRGVGLDAVAESISALSGEIDLESEPGRYTRFTLRLPLLAAISNALLFKVGGHVYALSLSHVQETLLLTDKQVRRARRQNNTIEVGGQKCRFLDLPQLFGVVSKRHTKHQPAFLGRWAHKRFVATCDKVVGPREIVVKPLSELLSPLPYFCGATISGAGKVQLVLDAAALARTSTTRKKRFAVRDFRAPTSAQRIMVCDDSRSIREVVSRILLQAGYTIEVASDGWDAWERLSGLSVDLLLTDLEMPRLDGYALIERIRRGESFRKLPIIVLTSRTGESNRKRAMDAGADTFVTKPVNKRVILEQVSALLQKTAHRTHKRG